MSAKLLGLSGNLLLKGNCSVIQLVESHALSRLTGGNAECNCFLFISDTGGS